MSWFSSDTECMQDSNRRWITCFGADPVDTFSVLKTGPVFSVDSGAWAEALRKPCNLKTLVLTTLTESEMLSYWPSGANNALNCQVSLFQSVH